jgi:hypothetical protein
MSAPFSFRTVREKPYRITLLNLDFRRSIESQCRYHALPLSYGAYMHAMREKTT